MSGNRCPFDSLRAYSRAISILHFQNVLVTLVVVSTDLGCCYDRLCSIAENDLGLNLSRGG